MIENVGIACDVNNMQNKSILPAAKGIMTTDMFPKVRSAHIDMDDNNDNNSNNNNEEEDGYKLVGIAKGAGMVEP